jgi:molecular chaperone GrpE
MNKDNQEPNELESVEPSGANHEQIIPESEPTEIDHQKAALAAAQRAEKEILYIRAEFDNYKKRLLKDQEQAIKMANKGLVTELLSVLDLFEHAIAHSEKIKSKGDKEVNNFVTGIEMTRSELTQLMQRFGVELIGVTGEVFDPSKHEAISEVQAQGTPNTILNVVQRGCLLHGKLLKPARVTVIKANE